MDGIQDVVGLVACPYSKYQRHTIHAFRRRRDHSLVVAIKSPFLDKKPSIESERPAFKV